MITAADISVVVQGPYSQHTDATLASLHRHLPGAEVILAVWAGAELSELAHRCVTRILLLNNDPGPIEFTQVASRPGFTWAAAPTRNLNRQIVSTRVGLDAATRPWTLKLRTDLLVTGSGFLEAARRLGAGGDAGWRIGEARIITTDVMSPDRSSMLHFVQDFAYFGRTADLRRLFSVPLVAVDEASKWSVEDQALHFAVYAEQYLWRHYVGARAGAEHKHAWECSPASAEACRRLYAANLVPLSFEAFGIDLLKYPNWKTAFRQEPTVNWFLRAAHSEWCAWAGEPADDAADAERRRQFHALYREFIRETIGSGHFLHFEINCANERLLQPYLRWLSARATRAA